MSSGTNGREYHCPVKPLQIQHRLLSGQWGLPTCGSMFKAKSTKEVLGGKD